MSCDVFVECFEPLGMFFEGDSFFRRPHYVYYARSVATKYLCVIKRNIVRILTGDIFRHFCYKQSPQDFYNGR